MATQITFKPVENNKNLKGQLAANKQTFGDFGRYAVAPVHTRFEAVEWFVWDAERPDDEGHATIIRQSPTLRSAIAGLSV